MDRSIRERGVFLSLQQPRQLANPYSFYRRLRSDSPVHWDFVLGGWFLTRYADVRTVLFERQLSTRNFPFDVSQLPDPLRTQLTPLVTVLNRGVIHQDASDHHHLRRPLNRAFGSEALKHLWPKMASLADDLLGRAEHAGIFDVSKDYARPLSNFFVCESLSLPASERAEFIQWCDQISGFMILPRTGGTTNRMAERAATSFKALQDYVRSLIAARSMNSSDDVIGRALTLDEDEAPLTEDDILANCVLLLDAGARNMAASLSNAIFSLLRNPKQFTRLRNDPGILDLAVEELLRFDTPVQVAFRGVVDEIQLGNHRIRPDQLLVLLLGAANRDPEQFPNPDELDLGRQPNRHLSFGAGLHRCVGMGMVRVVLAVAIDAILRRRTKLRLRAEKLRWNPPAMRRAARIFPVYVSR